MSELKSSRWTLRMRDASQAILLILIGNVLALIMSIPDDQLPTVVDIKRNLIMSIKFAAIPYILKNLMTDDVKVAVKTINTAFEKAADEKKPDNGNQ